MFIKYFLKGLLYSVVVFFMKCYGDIWTIYAQDSFVSEGLGELRIEELARKGETHSYFMFLPEFLVEKWCCFETCLMSRWTMVLFRNNPRGYAV